MSGLQTLGAGNRIGNESAPSRFRCGVGGEWKVASHFSQRQIQVWNTKSRRFPNLTPATVGIVCREHTGEPHNELQCQGPCNEWLPRDMFSKSTRTKGKFWCIRCTDWQLTNEPGYLPYVAPRGDASLDELSRLSLGVRSRRLRDQPIFDYDDEGDNESEWEEVESYLPTESSVPATTQQASAATMGNESASAAHPSTGRGGVAVTMRGGNTKTATASGDPFSTIDVPTNRHPNTGSHSGHPPYDPSAGRAPRDPLPSFHGPNLSSFQTGSAPSVGEAATTAGNAGNDEAPVLFNAYDGRGHVLRVEKAPTVQSDPHPRPHARKPGERSPTQSGWARPRTRKTDIMPPEYLKWHGLASNNNLDDPDGSDDEC